MLKLNGSFEHNRGRYKDREKEPVGDEELGGPKVYKPSKAQWEEIYSDAWRDIQNNAAAGVLTSSDRLSVEVAANLLAKFRAGLADAGERKDLIALLSKFGMTPADRSKIVVPKKKEETDEFAQLAAETRSPRNAVQ